MDTMHGRTRAMTVYALNDFLKCVSSFPRFLDDSMVERLLTSGQMFMKGYQALANAAVSQNLPCWRVTPKFHYFCFFLVSLPKERCNPRYWWTFGDEDFMGRVGTIVAKTHRSTLHRTVVLRYLTVLHVLWLGEELPE